MTCCPERCRNNTHINILRLAFHLLEFVTLLVAALCFSAIATAPPAFSKSIKAVPGNKATIPPGSTADVNGSTARIKQPHGSFFVRVCQQR